MLDQSARGPAAAPPHPAQEAARAADREWAPLPTVLTGHAARCPDRPALSFVDYSRNADGTWRTHTFAEVDQRARALAAALESRFPRGARVALLCPQGLEYGLGFLACLYAGMIAVPLFPPEDSRRIGQLTSVLADADPACLLTSRQNADGCRQLAGRRAEAVVWAVDEADPGLAPDWSGHRADPAEPAYLQYTSGSTGHPRGAVITHGNLVASTRQVIDGCGLSPDTPIASWLPLFHDMGLSIGVLAPILTGAHLALMSPLAFAQRPLRWLRLLDTHRAHFSGAPNFAYDLCVRRIPDRSGLDLSSVRVLTNGAEPVRTGTLRRFTEAFAACGLSPDAVKPSYGLAEATVLVACNRIGQRWTELRLDADALAVGQVRLPTDRESAARVTTVVGCGRPVGQDVRLADPGTGVEQPPGFVGELWVRGPNVAVGYWRQPDCSARPFDGTLKSAAGCESGWLRTGDLGFLHDGELFVLGRIKDVIIVNGANHAAGDVEDTVCRAIPEAVPGAVAAFAVPDDDGEGDRLVVVVELAAGPHRAQEIDLRRRVLAAVAEGHGIRPHDVLAVRRGSLPRTTSGKLRRGDCRDHYLSLRPANHLADRPANRPGSAVPTDSREAQ